MIARARRPLDPEIVGLAEGHAGDPEALLPILQALQARHCGLTRAAIEDVARALRLPPERAYGVASFYSMLDVLAAPRRAPAAERFRLCDGPACWLAGAEHAGQVLPRRLGTAWALSRSSCLGLCDLAPAALAGERQTGPVGDGAFAPLNAPPTYAQPRPGEVRVMLARAGRIDPDSLDSALEHGAYRGLEAALARPPEALLAEIDASGLAGRGGAGFPTGRKWRMVAQAEAPAKYIVCNADESEPLVFKDRVLIDSDPHLLLEGLALAGYAVGAREGYIYIRGEYGPQAARLERAIQQAEDRGRLGVNIAASGFDFHIHVHRGAGAYICGEETALLESLEGKRGEPRTRPPYPTTHGFRGRPTVVNNVETFAAAAAVAARGAEWYRAVAGTRPGVTPGTKLYTLLGHVNRPGLFEAPFGLTLRQIVEDYGGGMRPGASFHFALAGGAAGVLVPASLLDAPTAYGANPESIPLGAGAFLVCDQSVSPVALLRELLHFFEMESCGKCTPCRAGTRQAREILDRLAGGAGLPGDTNALARLAGLLQTASFCGLGQSAAMPIKSALKHFGEAFTSAEARNGKDA
jgi:NADH:ubiquinone oxidoreductase subunit F (NADH-binding)/NADH:ubiquinone oxidoreductase subunit E